MDNLREYATAFIFFFVASAGLIMFTLAYPSANGYENILDKDPLLNDTSQLLQESLGNYQEDANTDVNISTQDNPETTSESIQLVSTVSTTRNTMDRIIESINIIKSLVSTTLGTNTGSFILILGALFSIITMIFLLLLWKTIRTGE